MKNAAIVKVMENSRTILVVEDEAPIRRLTTRMLGLLGVNTLEAEDGRSALQIIHDNPDAKIDAVLTDVRLPDISGTELAVWIREQMQGMPVIYFTGSSITELDQEEMDRDDTFYLGKPFTKDSLLEVIESAFAHC